MWKEEALSLAATGMSWRKIAKQLGVAKSSCSDYLRKCLKAGAQEEQKKDGPKILILDVETAPLVGHFWAMWNNNIGLNQVEKDWHLLSWAAKWLGSPEDEVMYQDQSQEVCVEDDYNLCVGIRNLINQADVVIAHNGRKFDMKKLNARFILNGLPPVKPVKVIDTLEIAKQEFGFTSNKLAYLTDKLCVKYKKLEHCKYPGHTLWVEVLKGNQEAWDEMREYNIHDVLALEELYLILRSWSSKHPAIAIFTENNTLTCRICGGEHLERMGDWRTNLSVFPLYQCSCGAWNRGRNSSTTKEERNTFGMAAL